MYLKASDEKMQVTQFYSLFLSFHKLAAVVLKCTVRTYIYVYSLYAITTIAFNIKPFALEKMLT